MKLSPQYILARRLRKQWSADIAAILADWCEEHGLLGGARSLRAGPSSDARARIDAIACCLGGKPGTRRRHWELDWLPDYKPDAYEAKLLKRRHAAWSATRLSARKAALIGRGP